ncbi:MAG: phosphate ABC transporter permease subunit PstC [Syntrophothermus sp.]
MSPSDQTLTSENILKAEGRFSRPSAAPRNRRDQAARRAFFIITLLPVALIAVIAVMLFLRAWPIISTYSISDSIFGQVWQPSAAKFGFWPFIVSTIWVTVVGIILSVPLCLLVATYLAEYAKASTRAFARPILDVLAAIPPVVYGVWGLLAIVPFIDQELLPFAERWFSSIAILRVNQPTGFGILAAGIVLAVMIAPLIISIVYEVFATVPNDLRQASLAVGATQWQTIRNVVYPQVRPGILAAVVLGASRALGETIAVLIVVGNVAKVPTSIFDSAYPLPALIANNYGDMMSIPLYDAALLGAALILLVVILIFNLISQLILHRIILRRK